jgi:hypothetical protein
MNSKWGDKAYAILVRVIVAAFLIPITLILLAPFWKIALWAWGFIPW